MKLYNVQRFHYMLRKQDISVLILHYIGFTYFKRHLLKLRNTAVARFVVFHDILPNEESIFERNLQALKKKTNVISFADFFEGRLSKQKINTVITFDDGYKSWVTAALPILKQNHLPATFFVSSGFIGLSKDFQAHYLNTHLSKKLPPRKITGSLTEDDLKRIVDSGFTIGGHTINHVDLDLMNNEQQISYEILHDKITLERLTGTKIHFFSYPRGAYYNTHVNLSNLLRSAGYKCAVTVVPGFNNITTDLYLLHRDIMQAAMPASVFLARIFGSYDAVAFLKKIFTSRRLE